MLKEDTPKTFETTDEILMFASSKTDLFSVFLRNHRWGELPSSSGKVSQFSDLSWWDKAARN